MGFKSIGSSLCFSMGCAEEAAVCICIDTTPTQCSVVCDGGSYQPQSNIVVSENLLLFTSPTGTTMKSNCQLQQKRKMAGS